MTAAIGHVVPFSAVEHFPGCTCAGVSLSYWAPPVVLPEISSTSPPFARARVSEAFLQEVSAALSPPVVLRPVLIGSRLNQVSLMVTAALGYSPRSLPSATFCAVSSSLSFLETILCCFSPAGLPHFPVAGRRLQNSSKATAATIHIAPLFPVIHGTLESSACSNILSAPSSLHVDPREISAVLDTIFSMWPVRFYL
jgi:hypothetical protein